MPDVKKPAKLKICMICSEAHPIVKVGGLGDAVPALARELRAHGMDIRLLIPNYQDCQAQVRARIPLPPIKLGRHSFPAALLETNIGDVPVYLLDIPVLYDRPGVYGPRIDQAHHDNLLRFGALAAAVFPACRALNWQPDIIHGHDWQACLSPCLADLEPDFAGTPQVITIHNIGYQGDFPLHQMDDLGVEAARAIQCGLLLHGKINLLAGGIVHANAVTTVSAQYAQEIQGELGYGLQGIIQARRDDLYGIMNGMDYDEWNPATDPHLAQNFDYNSPQVFADKAINKTALQKELGLPLDKDAIVAGLVTRLVDQKGIDALANPSHGALRRLAKRPGLQLALLGSGEQWCEYELAEIAEEFPNVAFFAGYNEALSHRIVAGSDLFLMPSRYEPCGLSQLYAMRYGAVPVATATGGILDSVEDGVTGFLFERSDARLLHEKTQQACTMFSKQPQEFHRMQLTGMQQRFDWARSAGQYINMYHKLIATTVLK